MAKRVLYIEDDIDDQEILHEILCEKHIQIDYETANNGVEGLDKITHVRS